MNQKKSYAVAVGVTAVLFVASGLQGDAADLYIGDAANEGPLVTDGGGPRADSIGTLTYILHGGTAIYTAVGNQQLKLTEVNFFADNSGTLTPFVARYNGANSQLASSYELLSIGDPITVVGGDVRENRAFTVSSVNPVISLNDGDKLAVGWLQAGTIVYLREPGAGQADYIASGNALSGATAGGAPTLDSSYAFDRNMRFNIGVEVVSTIAPTLNFTGVETSSAVSDVSSTYNGDASDTDLAQSGNSTLASATLAPISSDSAGGLLPVDGSELNDGLASSANGVLFPNFTHSYTVTFDTTVNSLGYDLSQIRTFAGWQETTTDASRANQEYELFVSNIDDPTFRSVGRLAFGTLSGNGSGASMVTVNPFGSDPSIATGVDAVRLDFDVPAERVYQEIDIIGTAIPIPPEPPRPLLDIGAIWFIGDSITQSNADGDANGSPRKSLYDLLLAANANFSYTGHFTGNLDGLPNTDEFRYHSGISGSCIGANSKSRTNMTAGVPTWWSQNRLNTARPNAVLIMLGTNDLDLDEAVATAFDRIEILVNTILAQVGESDPIPAIFVAQIPPNTGSTAERERVVTFNEALPTIVTNLQGEGKDVHLVDQWTRINANTVGLMRDSLHTNAAGNDVLGEQWFNALNLRFAPAGYPAWQITHFGSTFAAESAHDEDPDGDLRSNFYEFIFGTDPKLAADTAQPATFAGAVYTVTRRKAEGAGVSYFLEESTTLEPGSWTTVTNISVEVIGTSGDFETVEITKSTGPWPTVPKLFLRTKATVNP